MEGGASMNVDPAREDALNPNPTTLSLTSENSSLISEEKGLSSLIAKDAAQNPH